MPIVFVCFVIVRCSLIICGLKVRSRSHAHWYAFVFTDNVARRLANEGAGMGVGGRCKRVVVVVVVLVVLVMSVLLVLIVVIVDVVSVVAL